MSKSNKRWLGMPYNWKNPSLDAVIENVWNTKKNAVLFPPHVWGIGWTLNFAYPLIKSKPLWKRILAFLLCLFVFLLVIYLLVVVCVLIYYLLTPNDQLVIVLK